LCSPRRTTFGRVFPGSCGWWTLVLLTAPVAAVVEDDDVRIGEHGGRLLERDAVLGEVCLRFAVVPLEVAADDRRRMLSVWGCQAYGVNTISMGRLVPISHT
jgi:hypothetical protein